MSNDVVYSDPMSPDNVRLDRVSDDKVRISWNAVQDDDACQTYYFITGTQNGKPISERVPGSERSYDISGTAQGDWRIEVSNQWFIYQTDPICTVLLSQKTGNPVNVL